jgi:hypothetical protein
MKKKKKGGGGVAMGKEQGSVRYAKGERVSKQNRRVGVY